MSARMLGLDLGGSSLKVVVLAGDGDRCEIAARAIAELPPNREPAAVLDLAARVAADLTGSHGPFAHVGLALPGLFDEERGTAVLLPNLPPAWRGFPVRDRLTAMLGRPVRLINDARAFSLAESVLGAGRGLSSVVCVVLGTGVGGGVVVNGRLLHDGRSTAGEIGHQTVQPDGPPCGCGNRGCVEALVSSAAIARLGGRDTVAEVYRAASDGDARASAAVAQTVRVLGIALGNAFALIAPDAFIVGGGVAEAGPALLDPLRQEVRRRVRLVEPERIRVLPAALGRHAGAVGAALWAARAG